VTDDERAEVMVRMTFWFAPDGSLLAYLLQRVPAQPEHLAEPARGGAGPGLAISRCCQRGIARALAIIAAIVSASCSLGLNWMNSVPVPAAGTCPGGM
jgi:hypothetical protein